MNTQVLPSNQEQLEALRAKFAGVASDVSLSNKNWRELMESGALASLSISRYRGHKQLSANDLGISQEDFLQVESIVSLGYRLLLPKAVLGAFNSLETRARQVLRQYTLKVPSGYFLPVSAYDACAIAMEDHKRKFNALVEELLYELPSHQRAIKEQYVILAEQVATRLYNAGVIAYSDKWTIADAFVDRCMATFPLADELLGQFRFDLRLQFVPTPYQTNEVAPQFANASADLMALRRAVVAEQTKIESEEIRGFISSIQSEVYTLVNESLSNVLESIQDKGFLQSRSSVQLRGLVERLSQLNFWQDGKLNIIRDEITAILDRAPQKRDVSVDTNLLEAMRGEVAYTLLQLGTMERGNFDLSSSQAPLTLPLSQAAIQAPIIITQAPPMAPAIANAATTSATITRSNRLF